MLAFLTATFGITWVALLPAVLARQGIISGPPQRFMSIAVIGFLSPMLAALFLSWRTGSARSAFRGLGNWRVGLGWYVVALLLPGATLALGMAVYALMTGADVGPWIYPPSTPVQLVGMLLFPFVDQIGWRGYLFPRLQERFGALPASLVLGAVWAFWHLQKGALLGEGVALGLMPIALVMFIAATVFYSWIYLHTRRSVLLVVVAQMGAYLNNSYTALPNATPLVVHTIGYAVVALGLVLGDRMIWRPSTSSREILAATSKV